MSTPDPTKALQIDQLSHRYGEREALATLNLDVAAGDMFGLLGPNGSGKSTLFRLICTIMPLQSGSIRVFGFDVATQQTMVRRQIGVVFQNPALDKQLTVRENLDCHGRLFGLRGAKLSRRIEALTHRLNLTERLSDLVHTLSGGMRRKVELAKALLPEPKLLLLDEPSTGLDVTARLELWSLLQEMRSKQEVSIVLTTHLMDEADRCDRLAILDKGRLLAHNTPDQLKHELGGDVITFTGPQVDQLKSAVEGKLGVSVTRVGRLLRLERPEAHLFIPRLIDAVPGMIDSVSVGRPTLDDVFIRMTGRQLGE
jgi:ABC-2 type transport system ATP-binding protein